MVTDHGNNLYPRFVTGNVEVSWQGPVLRPSLINLACPKARTTEA
jgi:hypothetical protein